MFKSALDYQDFTSYDRFDMRGHALDWANQPSVFKEYGGIEHLPLVMPGNFSQVSLSDLHDNRLETTPESSFSHSSLSSVLTLCHTITGKARYGASYFYYRSVASAGALYPFETYICAINVDGLEPGRYHHNVARNSLQKLPGGASRTELEEIFSPSKFENPILVFFLTVIFFRSSWKYRERAYRYHLLDTGHLLENLTLALKYIQSDCNILLDFNDSKANQFLNIDATREACLAAVTVPSRTGPVNWPDLVSAGSITDLSGCSKVSAAEIQYRAINDIHLLTSDINDAPDNSGKGACSLGLNLEFVRKIDRVAKTAKPVGYPECVFSRRSSRNFVKREMSSEDFDWMLLLAGASTSEQDRNCGCNGVVTGFLAQSVQGLSNGFYIFDETDQSIYRAKKGDLSDDMTRICLDQAWLANCTVHFLLMFNMLEVERRFGHRGYRRAMLTAGRIGQRLYLAATSLRLGCCGIGAFYDAEASKLLGLNDESRLTYLLGVGPLKKRSQNNRSE